MAEPQVSILSARAHALARKLAQREHRSIPDIVERALESYEARGGGSEPAAGFYDRLKAEAGEDIDLDSILRAGRKADAGPDL